MKRFIALAAAVLAVPAAAFAGDIPQVGGTYTGKMSCRSIHEGTPSKSKAEVSLQLLQEGADFRVLFGDDPMVGYLVADDTKAGSAVILLASCNISALFNTGSLFEGTAKVKANGKSKISGQLVRFNRESFDVEVCTGTLTRASEKAPLPTICS